MHRNFGADNFDTLFLNGQFDIFKRIGRSYNFERASVAGDIFGAGVESNFHQSGFGGGIKFDNDDAFFMEHPGHAAVGAEIPTPFCQEMADFGHDAIFIVGHYLQE